MENRKSDYDFMSLSTFRNIKSLKEKVYFLLSKEFHNTIVSVGLHLKNMIREVGICDIDCDFMSSQNHRILIDRLPPIPSLLGKKNLIEGCSEICILIIYSSTDSPPIDIPRGFIDVPQILFIGGTKWTEKKYIDKIVKLRNQYRGVSGGSSHVRDEFFKIKAGDIQSSFRSDKLDLPHGKDFMVVGPLLGASPHILTEDHKAITSLCSELREEQRVLGERISEGEGKNAKLMEEYSKKTELLVESSRSSLMKEMALLEERTGEKMKTLTDSYSTQEKNMEDMKADMNKILLLLQQSFQEKRVEPTVTHDFTSSAPQPAFVAPDPPSWMTKPKGLVFSPPSPSTPFVPPTSSPLSPLLSGKEMKDIQSMDDLGVERLIAEKKITNDQTKKRVRKMVEATRYLQKAFAVPGSGMLVDVSSFKDYQLPWGSDEDDGRTVLAKGYEEGLQSLTDFGEAAALIKEYADGNKEISARQHRAGNKTMRANSYSDMRVLLQSYYRVCGGSLLHLSPKGVLNVVSVV